MINSACKNRWKNGEYFSEAGEGKVRAARMLQNGKEVLWKEWKVNDDGIAAKRMDFLCPAAIGMSTFGVAIVSLGRLRSGSMYAIYAERS